MDFITESFPADHLYWNLDPPLSAVDACNGDVEGLLEPFPEVIKIPATDEEGNEITVFAREDRSVLKRTYLQEHMSSVALLGLSTRVITFTKQEIQWTCPSLEICESLEKSFNLSPPGASDLLNSVLAIVAGVEWEGTTHWDLAKIWHDTMVQYTEKISVEDLGRLPLLSPVAKQRRNQPVDMGKSSDRRENTLYLFTIRDCQFQFQHGRGH